MIIIDKISNTDISAEDLFEIFIAFIILIVAITMVIKGCFGKPPRIHVFTFSALEEPSTLLASQLRWLDEKLRMPD